MPRTHRAYLRAAEQLRERGGSVHRVVIDYELKRDSSSPSAAQCH
jgi:hypothetical protein